MKRAIILSIILLFFLALISVEALSSEEVNNMSFSFALLCVGSVLVRVALKVIS